MNDSILNLRCQSCGGTLNKTGDNEYECPFCHSKQVILESDEVKIEREWAKQGYKPLTESDKKLYVWISIVTAILLLLVILFM